MIKDIIVNIPGGSGRDNVTSFAVSAAAEFKAHLTGIVFRYEPIVPVMVDMYGVPPEVIESQRVDNEKVASSSLQRFNELIKGTGVSAGAHAIDASVDAAAGRFAGMARRFDLSVLGQPEPGDSTLGRSVIEAALFESGRPLLIVPYIQTGGLKLDRVMVCWDGSRSAARAVADAMPFLVRAKAVEITIVSDEQPKSDEMPGADIAHHLARHGARVDVHRISAAGIDVANAILSRAADASTDLMVMGGYGHSRMREFILGGATRGILGSMTVPTLMSH
jgi:nucleotide-binding universal stress UspA family protein